MKTPSRRVAHEIGHVLGALALNVPVQCVQLYFTQDSSGNSGMTELQPTEEWNEYTAMAIALSGAIAESLVFQDYDEQLASADMERVYGIARRLVGEKGAKKLVVQTWERMEPLIDRQNREFAKLCIALDARRGLSGADIKNIVRKARAG